MKNETSQRHRVLVVDDEAGARETLEALLRREGYELAFATSGYEALDHLAEHSPDAVLLDVMMPGIDGFEVCRRLKADPNWRHVPIVLVTALDSKQELAFGLDAGADDFIAKPVNGLELRARVRSMLRIKSQYDQLEKQRKELEVLFQVKSDLAYVTAQRLEELESLYKAGLRLMNSLEEDYIIEQISRTALELAPQAENCVTHLLSEDEGYLAAAFVSTRDGFLSIHPQVGTEDLVMQAIQTKDVVYRSDVEPGPQFADSPLYGLKTLLVCPMLVDRRCIGTLSVDSSEQGAFEEGCRRLLSILANQSAVMIMKARLFDELNRIASSEVSLE